MQGITGEIIEKISGLSPSASLCVGKGFSREEWKALCFHQDKALIQDSIQSTKQILEKLVPESKDRLLESTSRVELLRMAFQDMNLREACAVLSSQRFRSRFFEKLDRTLQMGRLLFAHEEEATVFQSRLDERLGADPIRDEFFLLNRFWDRLLEVREVWDEPRLYAEATERLKDGSAPGLKIKEYFKLDHFEEAPRVQNFWDEFTRNYRVVRIHAKDYFPQTEVAFYLKEAHSLEDAARFLIDELIRNSTTDGKFSWKAFSHNRVVIPDQPAVRRTLKRVAESRGISLLDPRDPTLLLQSEEIKTALLELEMVAKNFPAPLVLTWVSDGGLRKKIIENGIVSGLDSYRFSSELYSDLTKLKKSIPTRSTIADLKVNLLTSIHSRGLPVWVTQTFTQLFDTWEKALAMIGLEKRARPLRYWVEQIREKISKLPPMAARHRFEGGLFVQRADHSPSADLWESDPRARPEVHFFGVQNSFFDAKERGNEWFSVRALEVLAQDFGIHSFREQETALKQNFLNWGRSGTKNTIWSFAYDESGNECEPFDVLRFSSGKAVFSEKSELGAHPSLEASLAPKRKSGAEMEKLPHLHSQYPVSFLDAFGKCPFTAYAQYLLKLYDERETDYELAGDSYGNLIHAALEVMVKEKVSPKQAFDWAWTKTRPQGWLRSERILRATEKSVLKILENFKASEEEYQARSKAEPAHFELGVEWETEGVKFVGRVDRIDQHSDGLVLLDYKTSSTLPPGQVTLEKGIGLQLPLYSLAIQKKLNQQVVSAQYVQIGDHKINRNSGFLFSKWNKGKAADTVEFPLSTARANSKSLIKEEPAEIWGRLDEKIQTMVAAMKAGDYAPRPAEPKDCVRCRYELLCGRKRLGPGADAGKESEE